MSDQSKSPSGTSETPVESKETIQDKEPKKEDTVSYESYHKLLGEKKKRDAELAEYRKKEKDAEELKLKQSEEWKKLLELREQELQKERDEKTALKTTLEAGSKLQAFLKCIDGQVDQQYWGLVDLDNIVLNPETGLPDETSVKNAALDFQNKFALVIKKQNGISMPNQSPKGDSVNLSYDEWLKLPVKEKREKLKFVINKT